MQSLALRASEMGARGPVSRADCLLACRNVCAPCSPPLRLDLSANETAVTCLIALCTCPDEAVAERIATILVEEHLAACVNRLPGMISTYRWKGELCRETEQLLLIKTTRKRFDALRDRIVALHPYELPEVIAVDVTAGLDRYLAWVDAETRGAKD